jgi:cytochrome P450
MEIAKSVESTPLHLMPYEGGIPLLGAGLSIARDPMKFFARMVDKHGRIQRIKIGSQDIVFVHDADVIEEMLRLKKDDYNMSERNRLLTEPLLGNSMPVTTDLVLWKSMHSLMLPMFAPKMLLKYFDATRDAIAYELDLLAKEAQSGDTIYLHEFVRKGVFLALSKTIFARGIELAEIPDLLANFSNQSHYVAARYALGESFLLKLIPSARSGKISLNNIYKKIDVLIAARKSEELSVADDMLDVLIMARNEAGEPLSDQILRENVMALLFGGQETTPGSITWAFGLLAANPDKRQKMLDEIDSVLEGRLPTYQDIAKLKYTEMVLDEAMRLYPMFPFVGRETISDTVLDGYDIPKGTSMGFVAWTTHRDPRHWPEPDKFIPERHTVEARKSRPKCAQVSFGYGQRRCIGERVGRMESMLMLVMVSQKYLLEHEKGELPEYVVKMSPIPKNGMPVKVVARN